jgi:hypothetical protein
MRKVLEQGVSLDEVRAMIKRFQARDSVRIALMVIFGIVLVAAVVALVVSKLCLRRACEDCCDEDFEDEDETGCGYTTDEDFEK